MRLLRLACLLGSLAGCLASEQACDAPGAAAAPPLVSAAIVEEAYARLQTLGEARACPPRSRSLSHAPTSAL